MWIICCGMIRSASTLQYQLAAEIVERYGLGKRIEYVPENEFPALRKRYDAEPGLKVFKAHICTPEIQALFAEGKAKGIYSYRDIRDVAVSASKKFEMTFEDLIEKKWLDQAISDCALWRTLPNVLVSRYEQITCDLPSEVMRIAQHLGARVNAAEAEEIASIYSLEKQKERVDEVAAVQKQGGNSFDPKSLLHYNHINSGRQNVWKTALTSEQISLLEKQFGDWLQAMGYELTKTTATTLTEVFVPHLGWLHHEPSDEVATFLREGHFESIEQAFFWLYLRRGETFIDGGTHMGLFSVLAARAMEQEGRVISVEPNPKMLALLKRNLQEHGCGCNHIVEAALWSRNETLKFSNEAVGRAAYGHVTNAEQEASFSVPALTLADVMNRFGVDRATLVKLDTEGVEPDVLQGAKEVIAQGRLPLLMVEFTEQNLQRTNRSSKSLFELLVQLGYTVCRFNPETLQLDPLKYESEIWYENLFAATDVGAVNAKLKQAAPERIRISRDIISRGENCRKFDELRQLEQFKARAKDADDFRKWAEKTEGFLKRERELATETNARLEEVSKQLTQSNAKLAETTRKLEKLQNRVWSKIGRFIRVLPRNR